GHRGGYRDRPERSRPPERPSYPDVEEELEDARMTWPSASPEEIAGDIPPVADVETAPQQLGEQTALPAWPDQALEEAGPSDAEPAAAPEEKESEERPAKKGRRGRRGRKPRGKRAEASSKHADTDAGQDDAPPGAEPMPSAERRTEEDKSRSE